MHFNLPLSLNNNLCLWKLRAGDLEPDYVKLNSKAVVDGYRYYAWHIQNTAASNND
jgi:hypothetical protein